MRRHNQTIGSSAASDRSRIHNITDQVYSGDKKNIKSRNGDSSDKDRELARAQLRLRRRRKQQRDRIARIIGVVLVLAVVFVAFNIIRTYGTGSAYDSRGMSAYESADYDKALDYFKDALSYDGENADYYIHLGMTQIELQSYADALTSFNQAGECKDNVTQMQLSLRGQGIAYIYMGQYEEAVNVLDKALAIDAEKVTDIGTDILYYKAEAQNNAGLHEDAVSTYDMIIDRTGDSGAYVQRGLVYEAMGDYASAESDFNAAISKSKKSYSIYISLYQAKRAQGKDDEAKTVLEDALSLSGNSGEDNFNRGMIYLDLGSYDEAQACFEKCVEKDYRYADIGMGELYIYQEDYKQALTYYQDYFDSGVYNKGETSAVAKAYNQYAVCLMNLEQYDEALDALNKGIALNDRDAAQMLSLNMITLYEKQGEWSQAYNLAESYVAKYPQDAVGMREYTFLQSRVSSADK